jgi:murein DD-endopeptidase MepM/ murein hydrolase activator NlpD
VEGRIGDETTVRFGRVSPGEWVGLVPIAVGQSGRRELVLRVATSSTDTVTVRRAVRIEGHSFPSTELSVAPRYSSPPEEVLDRIERERELIEEALSVVTDEWLWDGRFTWPRPRSVTSPFGQRRLFNDELRSRHWGLDLSGRAGDPVRAAARGRVILAHHLYYAGKTVFLDHGRGVVTGYSHLSEIGVQVGDTVESGEVLGAVGATGRVTGPHLHWTLRVGGVRLDAAGLMELDVF